MDRVFTYCLRILENGARAGLEATVDNGFHIPFWLPTKRQECLHLCGHDEFPVVHGPEKWLDPISITNSNEEVVVRVIQTKRKLSSKMGKKGKSVVLIQSEYKFAITRASEIVAEFVNHFKSKAIIVINLSVDDRMNALLFVVKGLIPRWA